MSSDTGVSGQQIFDMLMESQFWPPDQMRDYQRSQLAQLLRHAKTHVPFYKTRLDCVLRNDGSIDWDRWEEIPIVTRADLRDHGEEMRADVIPKNHGAVGTNSTSGSTGVPITIQFNLLVAQVSKQAWNRFFQLHGMRESAIWAEFKPIRVSETPTEQDVLKIEDANLNETNFVIEKLLPTQRKLELLLSLKVTNLSDLPTHVEVLARENLRKSNRVKLENVIAIGMGVTDEQRELFLHSFGAKTLSPYSSKEGALMAFHCPNQPFHYHINSELVFMEILDDAGRKCAAGAQGRSIITPFFNTAQPMIRYDQGDQTIIGRADTCKITLPVLCSIAGRSDPIFRFAGKEFALTYPDIALIQKNLNADAYQIAQTRSTHVEVRYVSPEAADKKSIAVVHAHLTQHFPTEVSIGFVRVQQIPANSGGKQQRIVREYET